MTRLVDDSGWSITGGFETFGKRAPGSGAPVPPAARAWVGPRLEDEHDRDSPGTDSDRIVRARLPR